MGNGIDIYSPLLGLRSYGLNNVDLSVVIVNYRSWALLTKCLDSFKEYPPKLNYEIIVVDNDSKDDQFDKFNKKFTDIKMIANSGNYGFSSGCNLGASVACGKYLLFLNPDTTINSDNAIKVCLIFLIIMKALALYLAEQ